jgi:hypothetical protein
MMLEILVYTPFDGLTLLLDREYFLGTVDRFNPIIN